MVLERSIKEWLLPRVACDLEARVGALEERVHLGRRRNHPPTICDRGLADERHARVAIIADDKDHILRLNEWRGSGATGNGIGWFTDLVVVVVDDCVLFGITRNITIVTHAGESAAVAEVDVLNVGLVMTKLSCGNEERRSDEEDKGGEQNQNA